MRLTLEPCLCTTARLDDQHNRYMVTRDHQITSVLVGKWISRYSPASEALLGVGWVGPCGRLNPLMDDIGTVGTVSQFPGFNSGPALSCYRRLCGPSCGAY